MCVFVAKVILPLYSLLLVVVGEVNMDWMINSFSVFHYFGSSGLYELILWWFENLKKLFY